MIYIEHRKNAIGDLKNVDPKHGVEIDLRSDVSQSGKIHLAHDPWVKGHDFDSWLGEYARLKISGPLILNTKEDALEIQTLALLEKHKISNYIFLDTTVPTFVKWLGKGQAESFFLRLSRYEDLNSCLQFKDQVKWLWVDCFHIEAMDDEILKKAKEHFKLCMVSPELQGGTEDDFQKFLSQAKYFEAICTKKPKKWKELRNESV